MARTTHRLIWDGQCDFCRRSVAAVARRDREHVFEAVTSQSLGMGRLPSVLVETAGGQRLETGRACLFVLSELGHPGLARVLARRPLVWVVETGYRLVSRYRRFL
jgi:predicted DCC family thiol-disulfide oxidoreductase YuxK